MNEDQFISHLKALNLDQNISKYEKKIKNGMAELINMTNQIKIENFLSGDLSDLLAVDYIDVINSIKRAPSRIYNHFTGMNSGIILDWILSILHNPEAFARIVVKYFRNDNKNLSYFSAITFPSLFHHFFTDDFQKLSYQFLISMLESGDIGTFWYFCLSFIESSSNFSIVLWSNFLNLNENQDIFFVSSHNSNQEQSNFQPKIQRSQIFFRFLRCLEIASSALSVYQQKIVKKFSDANAPTCAFFLCKYFIERSFFWFRGNEPEQKNQVSEIHNSSPSSSDRSAGINPFVSTDSFSFQNESDSTYNETLYHNNLINRKNANYIRSLNEEIIKILEYASLNPKSPQFTTIVNVLTSSRYSRFVPNIVSSHTYFILSQRDCYLIQEIIKKNAKDKEEEQKEQNQNENRDNKKESDSNDKKENNSNSSEINFVKVFPLTKDSFNNFAPMSIEIPLVNFSKLYKSQKSFTPSLASSNNKELSLFPVKNDKLQKLLDLVMFDHFIDNEFSKRAYEQARSHFCFASKLLQKNQFVKRKMIDFNSFYGYFQSHNYKIKRHTHSNETDLRKPKKGITSYKSYYVQKTENFFDLPKLTPLSPEPEAKKCPLSTAAKSDDDSSKSQQSFHEKRNSRRRVVFTTNSDDDQNNSAIFQTLPSKKDNTRRKSLNIQKSFYDFNPQENRDFGYNNEEFVMKVETKTKKKRLSSAYIESTYQITSSELNANSAPATTNNSSMLVNNDNNNADKENNDQESNNINDSSSSQISDDEKLSKKKIKKQEKKRKKQEKKEKRHNKKEKNKEEKKLQEKNKEEDKEEKKEEKILLKENEKKEKKEKKEELKHKKEEEKLKKIRMKKEKRREKMRKNQEKKLKKNSEITLDGDFNVAVGNDDDDSDNDSNLNENRLNISDSSSNLSSNLSLNYNDQKNAQNVSSESGKDINNENEDNNGNDTKAASKVNKESNLKKFELRNVKSAKKKKYHSVHFDDNIRTYFSSSVLLTSSSSKENHPILNSLIPQIENNESKLILYCIKLNDFEFKSKKVDQITSQYVLLFNSQRLRKIKKYLTCHYNWFRAANFLASKIDFMSDFNIGTAIIIFCQICKYFSPLSSYSRTVLNAIPPSISSSNLYIESNEKSKNKNLNQDSPQCSTVEEESLDYSKDRRSSESNSSVNKITVSKDEFISNYSDTETSLDIYSYQNDDDYDDDPSSSNDNTRSNSQSDVNTNKISSVMSGSNDSKGDHIPIFPPTLISKDVVNFLRFVLMLSHTDCFIRYFTWITKVLVVFPQIKNIVHQIYGIDVSHLEIAFKTLLSKIDKPLLIEIGKEVFKKYDKGES